MEPISISLYLSLATDTIFVQTRLAQYANDLLSLGVDGLRLDASKSTFYGASSPLTV